MTFNSFFCFQAHLHSLHGSRTGEYKTAMIFWLEQLTKKQGGMTNDTNAIKYTLNDLNKVNKSLPYLTRYLMRQTQKTTQE